MAHPKRSEFVTPEGLARGFASSFARTQALLELP